MSYFLSRLSGTTKVAALTSRQVSNVVDTHESNGGYVPGFGAARRHHGGWDLASPGSVQGTRASGGTGHERSGVLAGAACDVTSVAQEGGDRVVLERPGEPAGRLRVPTVSVSPSPKHVTCSRWPTNICLLINDLTWSGLFIKSLRPFSQRH